MSIIWLCVGVLIGLFIPSPIDGMIKNWVKSLWTKLMSKIKTQNSE